MALSWEKVVVIVIIVVTVLLIILVNQNTFEEMKKNVGEVVFKFTNSVEVGSEELQGERPQITPEQNDSIGNLIYFMKGLAGNDKENCVSNYGGLVSMEGASVNFKQEGEGVGITISNKIGQFVESWKVDNLTLCLVAGDGITKNFENRFFKFQSSTVDYTQKVDSFLIFNDGKNKISYPGKSSLLESVWLFKSKANEVCLFPSGNGVWVGLTDENGLNTKYLTPTGKLSTIQRCS